MSKQPSPITDLLRETIIASKLPLLTLQEETGVKRASIMRFIRGQQSLRLDIADKLAAYFGLELRTIEEGNKPPARFRVVIDTSPGEQTYAYPGGGIHRIDTTETPTEANAAKVEPLTGAACKPKNRRIRGKARKTKKGS